MFYRRHASSRDQAAQLTGRVSDVNWYGVVPLTTFGPSGSWHTRLSRNLSGKAICEAEELPFLSVFSGSAIRDFFVLLFLSVGAKN